MKKIFAVLSLAALAVGCSSNNTGVASIDEGSDRLPAGETQVSLAWGGNSSEALKECSSSVKLVRESGTLFLAVDPIGQGSNCSNVLIKEKDGDFVTVGKMKGGQTSEKIALSEEYGQNNFVVRLQSNSKKTSADVSISSYKEKPKPKNKIDPRTPADFGLSTYLFGLKKAPLADCGGTVRVSVEGGIVYLTFRDLQKCSNFDILTDNGEYTEYKAQKIGTESNRSEKIAIPQKFYQSFGNSIKVIAKSNSSATFDVFRVSFFAW